MADPKVNINQTVNVELKENVKGIGKEFELLNQKGNNFHFALIAGVTKTILEKPIVNPAQLTLDF